ncbi:MAG: hypothetical protein IPJ41_09160 [Phycisphaerales bacterium]|nr:hypothetical protein [Phycisphaerales bacterium]
MSPHDERATEVRWSDACATLRHRIANSRRQSLPFLVGITGPVGSGKSSLARALGGASLSDDYLPDYAGIPESKGRS